MDLHNRSLLFDHILFSFIDLSFDPCQDEAALALWQGFVKVSRHSPTQLPTPTMQEHTLGKRINAGQARGPIFRVAVTA